MRSKNFISPLTHIPRILLISYQILDSIDQLKEGIVDDVVGKFTKNLKPLLINKDNKEDEILTLDELAEYLKITANWIYKRVSSKEIPYFKVEGNLRF